MTDEMRKLFDAIFALKAAFARLGPEMSSEPVAISLSGPRAGADLEMALMVADPYLLRYSSGGQYRVIAFDGQPWREIEILGVKVRWPARVAALEGGGIRIS